MHLRLKELRESRKLSQQAVADSVGCTAVTYSRYETGQREPSIEMLVELSKFFEVSVDYIVGRSAANQTPLTEYERLLIDASRGTDDRVREIVLEVLKADSNVRK